MPTQDEQDYQDYLDYQDYQKHLAGAPKEPSPEPSLEGGSIRPSAGGVLSSIADLISPSFSRSAGTQAMDRMAFGNLPQSVKNAANENQAGKAFGSGLGMAAQTVAGGGVINAAKSVPAAIAASGAVGGAQGFAEKPEGEDGIIPRLQNGGISAALGLGLGAGAEGLKKLLGMGAAIKQNINLVKQPGAGAEWAAQHVNDAADALQTKHIDPNLATVEKAVTGKSAKVNLDTYAPQKPDLVSDIQQRAKPAFRQEPVPGTGTRHYTPETITPQPDQVVPGSPGGTFPREPIYEEVSVPNTNRADTIPVRQKVPGSDMPITAPKATPQPDLVTPGEPGGTFPRDPVMQTQKVPNPNTNWKVLGLPEFVEQRAPVVGSDQPIHVSPTPETRTPQPDLLDHSNPTVTPREPVYETVNKPNPNKLEDFLKVRRVVPGSDQPIHVPPTPETRIPQEPLRELGPQTAEPVAPIMRQVPDGHDVDGSDILKLRRALDAEANWRTKGVMSPEHIARSEESGRLADSLRPVLEGLDPSVGPANAEASKGFSLKGALQNISKSKDPMSALTSESNAPVFDLVDKRAGTNLLKKSGEMSTAKGLVLSPEELVSLHAGKEMLKMGKRGAVEATSLADGLRKKLPEGSKGALINALTPTDRSR